MMSHLVVALAAAATAASGPPASLEVQTPYGTVRGFAANHTRAFRGIPYALAPTGKNRFRPPQIPPARWAGVRDARAFGANCIQIGSPAVSGGAGHGAWDSLNVTDSSEVGWGGGRGGTPTHSQTFSLPLPPSRPSPADVDGMSAPSAWTARMPASFLPPAPGRRRLSSNPHTTPLPLTHTPSPPALQHCNTAKGLPVHQRL